jgi:hypothetical protein
LRVTSRRCQASSVAGARGSPRTPRPTGAGGLAGTAPRATAGRPAGSGPGRSGGAAPRSRAGAPAARRPWTPPAGPAPSGSPAVGTRAGRQPRRSLSDNLKRGACPGQARPDRVIEPSRFWQGGGSSGGPQCTSGSRRSLKAARSAASKAVLTCCATRSEASSCSGTGHLRRRPRRSRMLPGHPGDKRIVRPRRSHPPSAAIPLMAVSARIS